MSYKVLYKKDGEKKWSTCMGDDFAEPMYFKTKKEAKKYSGYLKDFKTKIIDSGRSMKGRVSESKKIDWDSWVF